MSESNRHLAPGRGKFFNSFCSSEQLYPYARSSLQRSFQSVQDKEEASNIKLYVRRIFNMDNRKDIIPEYLNFSMLSHQPVWTAWEQRLHSTSTSFVGILTHGKALLNSLVVHCRC